MAGTRSSGGGNRSRIREAGARLLELRQAAGLTQRGLAEAAELPSHARVSQMETGRRLYRADEMTRVLDVLKVAQDERGSFMELARGLEGPGRISSGLPGSEDVLMDLVEFERAARRIFDYATIAIPGLLQTSNYARAILSAGADTEKRVALRLGRRDVLLRRNPVEMVAVIETNVLSHPIVPREHMIEQMHFLLEMGARDNVTVQLIESTKYGWHSGRGGPFELIEFPKASPIVLLEHRRASLFLWDSQPVQDYVESVDEIRGLAMGPGESAEFIKWFVEGLER